MSLRVDAGDFSPGAAWVRKLSVTTDTKSAAAVNGQTHRIPGVIIIGAVAVFTTYGAMRGVLNVGVFIFMTPPADLGGLVF